MSQPQWLSDRKHTPRAHIAVQTRPARRYAAIFGLDVSCPCLQVKGDGYAAHEEGNTLSYDDLQKYLDDNYSQHNLNVEEHFIPRMQDIIIDTFLSVKKKMNQKGRKNCYELFGFDFLLDEDFRIWLIECNHNPYLGTPCEFMRTLVPNMINDMLKIVLDPVLKPKNVSEPERENDFVLLYREGSQKHGPAVNVRRPYTHELVYPVPELTPFIGKKKVQVKKEMPRYKPKQVFPSAKFAH